jgi:hypothetical protein
MWEMASLLSFFATYQKHLKLQTEFTIDSLQEALVYSAGSGMLASLHMVCYLSAIAFKNALQAVTSFKNNVIRQVSGPASVASHDKHVLQILLSVMPLGYVWQKQNVWHVSHIHTCSNGFCQNFLITAVIGNCSLLAAKDQCLMSAGWASPHYSTMHTWPSYLLDPPSFSMNPLMLPSWHTSCLPAHTLLDYTVCSVARLLLYSTYTGGVGGLFDWLCMCLCTMSPCAVSYLC